MKEYRLIRMFDSVDERIDTILRVHRVLKEISEDRKKDRIILKTDTVDEKYLLEVTYIFDE